MKLARNLLFTGIIVTSISASVSLSQASELSDLLAPSRASNQLTQHVERLSGTNQFGKNNKLPSNGCHADIASRNAFSNASAEAQEIIMASRARLQQELSPSTRSMATSKAMAAMPANVTIPVVVHVVHNYGPELIGEYQITDAIDQMNEDYAAWPYAGSVDGFGHLQADIGVTFKLATLDPWGNSTSGITYTVSNTTYDGTEGPLQNTINWPRDKYLNIWVINSSDGTGSGSAYSNYPSTVDNGTGQEFWDGIVVSYWAMGRTGAAISTHHKIMSHEAGHWLNLKHIWGDVYNNGDANSCSTDDEVNDTPNTSGNTGCYAGYTCGTADNSENFMDYGTCTTMFSYGQSDRMRAALASPVADRNNLWTDANLIATGLLTGSVPPVVNVNGPYTGVIGTAINFSSAGTSDPGGSIVSYSWDFGDGSNSTQANPSHTYSSNGSYTVTLTVTDNEQMSTTKTTTALIIKAGQYIGAESEPNNSASQANGPIGPIPDLQGQISSASDKDWFYFDLTGPDSVSITMNILGNYGDLDFWVYHESDLNNWVAEAYGNTAVESVQFSANQGGRYYVHVDGWSSETGSYDLHIEAANIDGGTPSDPVIPNANGPYSGETGRSINFSSAGSTASTGNTISSYSWSFGDGGSSSQANPNHSYTSAATFPVSLTVTDSSGSSVRVDTTATITEAGGGSSPIAITDGPFSGTVNSSISMSSNGSYDPDGSIASYYWNFGDGADSTLPNPSHSYSSAGAFTVSLTVTDNSGATGTTSTSATVTGGNPPNGLTDACASQSPQDYVSAINGMPICVTSGSGDYLYFYFYNDGASSATIRTGHGSGDADLYYSNSGWPEVDYYSQRSINSGNEESILVSNLSNGWNYIMLNGDHSGVTLQVDMQ